MIAIATLAAATLAGLAWGGETYTQEQLEARFPYDLGSAVIDVSGYPQEQRENYKVFERACSQCHSLARPINAPILTREDWRRFVRRMHLKTAAKAGVRLGKEDAKAIVDFLAYDSKIRKLEGKAVFEARQKELQGLFGEVQKERRRLKREADNKKARQTPMGTTGSGVRPQP
jgi:hypothetical protein